VEKIVYSLLLCNQHAHTENSHTDGVHLESRKRQLILVTTQKTERVSEHSQNAEGP